MNYNTDKDNNRTDNEFEVANNPKQENSESGHEKEANHAPAKTVTESSNHNEDSPKISHEPRTHPATETDTTSLDNEEDKPIDGTHPGEEAEITTETVRYQPAGIPSRALSYLADILIIYALTNLFFGGLPAAESPLWIVSLASVGIIGSLYFLLTTYFFQQTIGKMIFGIEVIGSDGNKPGFLSLIFREVIGRLVSQLGGLHIGYLWGAFHPRRQTWHDIFGETYVVCKNEDEQEKYIEIERETNIESRQPA